MEKEERRSIGERLRRARLAARLTQEDVATDFILSRQAISSWEAGRTLPGLLEFRELAALYGVSSDKLLYGLDDVEKAGRFVVAHAQAVRAPLSAT